MSVDTWMVEKIKTSGQSSLGKSLNIENSTIIISHEY